MLRSAAAVIAVAVGLVLATAASAAPPFQALDPGGPANYAETVPVQFVFVGYEPGQVDQAGFLDQLPQSYDPVVRSRLWYGITEKVGVHYTYDYDVVYADSAYEDAFFARLDSLAVPESQVDGLTRTLFQDLYNDQENNVLDVGTNYFIDAPSVERWLYKNPPAGVNPSRNTVFFVNWWGRPDFKFHTYVKLNEPDPDTGYDFGLLRQSRKIIAWGGTGANDEETGFGAASRVWFYDLSAGPESWTSNWNVDDADVDGDGVADYRMPPIWEYLTPGGYRSASALTGDLGKVARYVAINLLFTSSPLYPPYLTPNRQPLSINLDSNTYEGWTGVDASTQYLTPELVVQEVGELERIPVNTDQQDLALTGKARECYFLWLLDVPCYPNLPYPPFANLFLYNAQTQDAWRNGGAEYEAGLFNYATDANFTAPFLGFADDNYIDGTQSGIFNFVSRFIVSLGYGLSTTQIHEYGHHTAMSHPHDGYDSETGVDYEPTGDTYFAWSGDESNSIMSYIDLNWDFSQFDLDNMARFKSAAFMKVSNAIAADVLASPEATKGLPDLLLADARFAAAQSAMASHDYEGTFQNALLGYKSVRSAADKAGVEVTASNRGWVVVSGRGKSQRRAYAYRDRIEPGTHRQMP